MGWVTLNEDECPGCQRRGDTGDRVDGKCWRCNLPSALDPEEHAHLLPTLEWELRNLLSTLGDVEKVPDRRFEADYGVTKAYVRPILQKMLARNRADIDRLEADEEEAA